MKLKNKDMRAGQRACINGKECSPPSNDRDRAEDWAHGYRQAYFNGLAGTSLIGRIRALSRKWTNRGGAR